MLSATTLQNTAQAVAIRIAGSPWSGPGLCPIYDSVPLDTAGLTYHGAFRIERRHKSWSGVSASVAEMRCDGNLRVDLDVDATRLSVVLEEIGGPFEVSSRNWRNNTTLREFPRPLSIIPAGLEAHGRADNMRFMRHLLLQFDLPALARMAEDEFDPADVFTPRLMFSDASVMRLAQLFAEECSGDEPHSRLYGDTLSIVLLLTLARLSSLTPSPVRSGSLAPWQVRRVTEYLTAHLAEDVELQTVSSLVNLSRSHFSRAFKISTGLPPHQWQLQARIAKAKELMLQWDRPLAQIAIEVGFADQAHFSRTFGCAVGESPGAWRRTRGM
jgi:AraC family transcriptional regulator